MNKIIKIIFILIITFAFIQCSKEKDESHKKIESIGKRYVTTSIATRKDLEKVLYYSGKLEAIQAAYIAPELSMKILKFYVDEGDIVEKGDLLIEMDDTQLEQIKAQYENAKKNYNRMKILQKKGSVDKKTLEDVETAYITAKTSYEYVLSNTKIRAPFSGVITRKYKNAGENFVAMIPGQSGEPAILRLVNPNRLKVNINISDSDIDKINIGQKAFTRVKGENNKKFWGEIIFISQEANLTSGKFLCSINLDNSSKELKPNQYAEVGIIIKKTKNTIVVPESAIVETHYVFVIKNSIAKKHDVKIGLRSNNEVEILSGISENEVVITKGNVGLFNNSKVEIKEKL